MGQNYKLVIYNNSTYTGQVIVYQGKPQSNIDPGAISTLAWLSLGVQGREGRIVNSVEFDWTIDYGFVWSRGGVLLPGVQFIAAGGAPIDTLTPPVNNAIQFVKGAQQYTFTNQTNGQNGNITIQQMSSVVAGEASIGVSMSGAGVFAVPARPSFTDWFIPHPSYTVALGSYTAGQVMDIAELSALNPFQYDAGVTSLAFTYNEDGTWTKGAPAALGGTRVFDLGAGTSRRVVLPEEPARPAPQADSYYDVQLGAAIPHGSGILNRPCSVVFTYPDGSHSMTYTGTVFAWRTQTLICMQSRYMNIEAAWVGANGGTLTIDATSGQLQFPITGFTNITLSEHLKARANGHHLQAPVAL